MGTKSDSPILIVGLGNPGPKYALTRHNIGFIVIDLLAHCWPGISFTKKFHGEFAQTVFCDKKVILLKPQTYMNKSGLSVAEAVTFYKIETATNLLVISDDIDLSEGSLRLRINGGTGGHNGLRSLFDSLGTEEFLRLRVGVGRSPHLPPDEHVLSQIAKKDLPLYEETTSTVLNAVEMYLKDGFLKTMNTFNKKVTNEP